MKKLFMTVTVLASLLLTFGLAQALDPEAAKELSLAKGGINMSSPDGKFAVPDGWVFTKPEVVLAWSEKNAIVLKPVGYLNATFYHQVNQISITACASRNNTLILKFEGGYIPMAGCYAW